MGAVDLGLEVERAAVRRVVDLEELGISLRRGGRGRARDARRGARRTDEARRDASMAAEGRTSVMTAMFAASVDSMCRISVASPWDIIFFRGLSASFAAFAPSFRASATGRGARRAAAREAAAAAAREGTAGRGGEAGRTLKGLLVGRREGAEDGDRRLSDHAHERPDPGRHVASARRAAHVRARVKTRHACGAHVPAAHAVAGRHEALSLLSRTEG